MSVVIPTYQRREVVLASVAALERQIFTGAFEVVAVVDGSTDGSAEALRALRPHFPLHVLTQENRGAACARNAGVAAARGDIILFLDDDMEAAPEVLAEHVQAHRAGAEVVVGQIAPHAESLDTLLADSVASWYKEMATSLTDRPDALQYGDILTGHVSMRRDLFDSLGGFDEEFTAAGTYGNEDVDLAYRIVQAGRRVVFNPRAVARQRYVVTARSHLSQYRQAGRADVALVRKHPELSPELFEKRVAGSTIHRLVWRPVLLAPRLAGFGASLLTPWVVRLVDAGRRKGVLWWLFMGLREVGYWRGVADAGGIPASGNTVRVLCYHAIADLTHDRLLTRYGVPPEQLAAQLRQLQRARFQFIDPEEFARYLGGGAVPRGAVLVTFDDCYRDLTDQALPILTRMGIRALAFAVTQRLGASNTWDEKLGATRLELLDAEGLRAVLATGSEIGSHTRTHPPLTKLSSEELRNEITGSKADLEALGLPRPRFLAYPYGDHDERVTEAVAAAGIPHAFTVVPGRVTQGSNALALPRIEILRSDRSPWFVWKVRLAGRYTGGVSRAVQGARRATRKLLGSLRRRGSRRSHH